MCRVFLYVMFLLFPTVLYGKRPPYNLDYHIKDVWDYVDSVRERNNLPDTVTYSMRWRVQPPLTDTLLSLSIVLNRCIERGVVDEKIYMELSRIYITLGRYDDAYSVISPDVKPSRAALWYALLALCEGNRRLAVFYKDRIDHDWAVSNYPDVMAGIDAMCEDCCEVKNKYVAGIDTMVGKDIDTASAGFFNRKYKEVYDLYVSAQYSTAQSIIESMIKDEEMPHTYKARCHLLLALCRGRLYGKESMLRSMRAVEALYEGTRQGDFARKVLDVYDK